MESGPEKHDHHAESGGAFDRRAFLQLAGFTLAGTGLAGCERGPATRAIPFLVQPEEVVPGRATWYASTCGGCNAGCGVLVKNRDGRPIKIEGNPDHPVSRGGLCAIGQAYLLGLYDSQRLSGPLAGGKPSDWPAVDAAITKQLDEIATRGGTVRLLTGTVNSPATRAAIEQFLARFSGARHISYDALSVSAILDAHERTHGARVLPRYRFERADVIVAIEADFLGTWISPVEYTAGYVAGRPVQGEGGPQPAKCSLHVQLESRLSLTGAKADRRIRIRPADTSDVLAALAAALTKRASVEPAVEPPSMCPLAPDVLNDVVDALWQARGRAVVVCGVNELEPQVLTNAVNHLLDAYGATIDVQQASWQATGSDSALHALIDELHAGKVDALIVAEANPVYDLPDGEALGAAIRRVPLVVSLAERVDETAELAHFVCPQPHALESWRDAEPVAGAYCVTQPVIRPLGKTRTLLESLAAWSGQTKPASARELLQAHWKSTIFPRQSRYGSFQEFWDRAVHDGFVVADSGVAPAVVPNRKANIGTHKRLPAPLPRSSDFELVLYPKVSLRDGRHAHNPWLQELPDPITKIAWDNYASLSPATASRLQIRAGYVLRVTVSGKQSRSLELPAHIQPGQHDDVIAIALGYGRKGTERFAAIGPQWLGGRPTVGPNGLVGVNAAPLLAWHDGHVAFTRTGVTIEKTGRTQALASTQQYHSIEVPEHLAPRGKTVRDAAREVAFVPGAIATTQPAHAAPAHPSMWDQHAPGKHRWGMAIDLAACTGCGACVIGCQAENNIPVVGKDELARGREMHWLRIDRYYEGGDEDPHVLHQPMLCQHCANAPCETVCPVLATVHSADGLNQQVYNRCVGTRYCANNCPYKMRRFNWFNYAHGDEVRHLVLNPDVTIRSRGVMEKCSFCVQRIQAGRLEARRRGEELRDGNIQPACQQSCPAKAIVFGDLNDPQSAVSRRMRESRAYQALEELNVRPAVTYLAAVRSGSADQEVHHG